MLTYQIAVFLLLLGALGLVLQNLKDYCPLRYAPPPLNPLAKVYLLIPARNEIENIQECLQGLCLQTWGAFTLLVLDDDSEDGTGELIAEIARTDLRVRHIKGASIQKGWAGKVWACSQLGAIALEEGADWLLFLDADTRAQPEMLATILRHAEETQAGMTSGFPYQITGSFWEEVALPMLQFLIVTFLPVRRMWETSDPKIVAGCGQVELFSAEAYRAVGGHASIPTSFHDGLQLARKVKASGRTVRLFDISALLSCRMYRGGREVWNGFTRNAYEGLGGFYALFIMTVLQGGLFLAPFVFALWAMARGFSEIWMVLCLAQICLILAIRLLQSRRFGHLRAVFLHPLSIIALITIQWASFYKSKRKSQIAWKGRTYTDITK